MKREVKGTVRYGKREVKGTVRYEERGQGYREIRRERSRVP
jgi:hypothetical protein